MFRGKNSYDSPNRIEKENL